MHSEHGNLRVLSRSTFLIIAFAGFAVIAIAFALHQTNDPKQGQPNAAALTDSVATLNANIRQLSLAVPGLGEYMTSVQLHVAKMWFAVQYKNWRLAKYELDELGEAMDAASALHVTKNNVNITEVLTGVKNGSIPPIDDAIAHGNNKAFIQAYDQLLTACNGCHTASDHGFIKIERPRSEPVSNQQWAP
jgi:hypothetical protein